MSKPKIEICCDELIEVKLKDIPTELVYLYSFDTTMSSTFCYDLLDNIK